MPFPDAGKNNRNKIAAVLITLNEESNLLACLETVRWADEIVVVDSGSSDRTVGLARQFGAKVYHEAFKDFASQKNAAIGHAACDWIFLIDADERVSGALAAEIMATVESDAGLSFVYAVERETYFLKRRLRYSGTKKDAPVRLFPKAKVRYVQPVHEEIDTTLPVRRLRNRMAHYSNSDLTIYTRKLRQYVALEIEFMARTGRRVGLWDVFLRPPAKFFYLYLARWGILDGVAGFLYAFLSSVYDARKFWGGWKRQMQDSRCRIQDAK
jgi:glycosyltransferase involved in cell wall biosynthesis